MYINHAQQTLLPLQPVAEEQGYSSPRNNQPEYVYSVAATDSISLRVLFLRHMKQQRWVYFLNQDLSLKTNNYPVLQVKLNQQHNQFDAVEKIISCGQAGAVIIEKPALSQEQIALLKQRCQTHSVILILLESHLEQCH